MQDPLSPLPGYSLRRAATAMMSDLTERLTAVSLRYSEAGALMMIAANANITASALGRMLDIQRTNMAPLIGRLEASGLIERTPLDGKSSSLQLTSEGRARLAAVKEIIDAFEADLINRVPKEHRAHLLPALSSLWQDGGKDGGRPASKAAAK